MALTTTTIGELNPGSPLQGTDIFVIERIGGNNFRITSDEVKTFIGTGLGLGHVIEDEGTPLTQRSNLNFVGAGVTVTDADPDTIVTIPGGVGSAYEFIQDEGTPVAQENTINFVGAGVVASTGAGVTTVTIPGGIASASLATLTDVALTGQAIGGLLVNVDGTNWEDLPVGSNTEVLTIVAGIPTWAADTGGGEINLGANVGAGTGLVFRDKTGVTLNFKSLIGGTRITVVNLANDIQFNVPHIYEAVLDEGVVLTQRTTLNFVGAGVVASDFGGDTLITIPGGIGTPLTTKGDLFSFDTGDTRLPVGTPNQILSVDAAEATGLKWIDPSGGSQTPWTSQIDAAGNNLINFGFLESNATTPAGTGAIRLGNTESITWKDFGGTDRSITLTANDKFEFDRAIKVQDFIEQEGTVATAGFLRMQNSGTLAWATATPSSFSVSQANGFNLVSDTNSLGLRGSVGGSINSVVSVIQTNGTSIQDAEFISPNNDGSSFEPERYVFIRHVMENRSIVDTEEGSYHIAMMDSGIEDTPYMSFNNASSHTIEMFKPLDMSNQKILDINPTTITDFSTVTAVSGDFVWIIDATDGLSKKADVLDFLSAASQTPWTSQIDAAGNSLINVDFIETNSGSPALAGFIRMTSLDRLTWRAAGNEGSITVQTGSPLALFKFEEFDFLMFRNNASDPFLMQFFQEAVLTTDTEIGRLTWFTPENDGSSNDPAEFASMIVTMEDRASVDLEDASFKFQMFQAGTVEIFMSMNDSSSNTVEIFKELDMSNQKISDINPTTITDFATVTAVAGDFIWIIDATDGLSKKANASDFLGGGSLTPWTENIDAANFNLSNIDTMDFNGFGSAITGIDTITMALNGDISNLDFIAQAGTPATTGAIRLNNGRDISWRNSLDTANNSIDYSSGDVFNVNRGAGGQGGFRSGPTEFVVNNDFMSLQGDTALTTLEIFRIEELPADTVIAHQDWRSSIGEESSGVWVREIATVEDATAASEDGSYKIECLTAGSLAGYISFNDAALAQIDILKPLSIADGIDIVIGTTTGTKFGTSATQKIGFFDATPIIQPIHIADASGGATIDAEARTALNALLAQIAALGLQASS